MDEATQIVASTYTQPCRNDLYVGNKLGRICGTRKCVWGKYQRQL